MGCGVTAVLLRPTVFTSPGAAGYYLLPSEGIGIDLFDSLRLVADNIGAGAVTLSVFFSLSKHPTAAKQWSNEVILGVLPGGTKQTFVIPDPDAAFFSVRAQFAGAQQFRLAVSGRQRG